MFKVYEMIGNFSHEVFTSDIWNEVQDYLTSRWWNYCAENGVDLDNNTEEELFYSYFSIDSV